MPVTLEEPRQRHLNNRASYCWTISPVIIEQMHVSMAVQELRQWLLKSWANDFWNIGPVTVEELLQQLLKNCASYF